MFEQLKTMLTKPALYEKGTTELWTDPHISKGMLEAHLHPDWDAATRNHATVQENVKWISKVAPAETYRNLLDLGCGPGIYAEAFHKAGYCVTGMDISERSIRYARASAQEKNLLITYRHQNFITMDFEAQFDLVTLIYFDFCVNSTEDRATIMKNIYAALKPGGLLIIELTMPQHYANRQEERKWEFAKSGFFSDEPHLHLESFLRYDEDSTILKQSILITEQNVRSINIWHHAFTKDEFTHDLNAAGLSVKVVCGNMTGADYNDNGEEMCFIAEKRVLAIPGCEHFTKIEPIHKGWDHENAANDKKYYIETNDNQRLLLRIADVSEYENKKAQSDMLAQIRGLNIPMARPVKLGLCNDGKSVYQLLTWVEGDDIESQLPTLSEVDQYKFGLKAGAVLTEIHTIRAPKGAHDWVASFNTMLQEEMETYRANAKLHCAAGEVIMAYFADSNNTLGTRPQTFLHGDYNPGNLIIMPDNEIGVIDFSCEYGDPCWDIFKVSWRPARYPHFYSGQIRGLTGEPTLAFWLVYTHYFAYGALLALRAPRWAGINNLEEGREIAQDILTWSDNLRNPIPAWYVNGR
ncbi:MAG: class I SAM-dependent methyltransferase [Defluviitaleaceae bacterium]|nr:class I SAM-dependent methyltransferase [Defluviitaleaceae bacterium]